MKRTIHTVLLIIVSSVLVAGVAWSGSPSGEGGIPARVKELEVRVAALETAVADLEAVNARQDRIINDLSTRLTAAEEVLENARSFLALSRFVRVHHDSIDGLVGPHIIFTGANVHIRSGSGNTWDPGGLTGRGNLIVGYNEAREGGEDDRRGSHNIIVGERQNFTSHGGLVAGGANTVSGGYATVTGGIFNVASGQYCSISGGYMNEAGSFYSSVSGGTKNKAKGPYASVSGGYENEAEGANSAVSGGIFNAATGNYSSVSGGGGNNAIGDKSSISGGNSISISGDYEWAAGSLVDTLTALTIDKSGTVDITSDAILNLKGSIINLNGGGRPVSGVGDFVIVPPGGVGTISTGSPSVFIPIIP